MAPRRRPSGWPSDPPGALYPTLDLHGLTADEAARRTRSWLEARSQDGEAVVRVITGRGRHSIGEPVLLTEIRELLGSLTELVANFETDASGGAYLVRLRFVERRSTLPPQRTRQQHDPGLIREAEEALAELGIQATPALVAAEIERLLRNRKSAG